MASATLSSTAAAEGAPADSLRMPSTLELTGFIDEHLSGTSFSVMSEGSGPSCGVGPSALGAVTSPDGTHPPGSGEVVDAVTENPVLGTEVPTGLEGAELDAANSPDPSGIPEVNDPMDPSGQGLSPAPEGTSESLPCWQRVATPELTDLQNSSFEVISDTESEKHPDRRMAPASGVLGTLGGETGVDPTRPPLNFDDLFALVHSAPMETYDRVAANGIPDSARPEHAGCASDGHGDGQSGNHHRDLPTSRSTSGRRTSHTSRFPGTCPLSG